MTYPYRLLAPGPVQIPDYARKILAEPMLHHRSPLFTESLKRVFENLKKVFYTTEPVYILSSTGTGAMEAAIANTISKGDQVLAINAGKFGERWAKIAERYGAEVKKLDVTWGESVSVASIQSHLKSFPDTKAVLLQATETSTGALQAVKEVADIVKKYPKCLLMVDAITAILSSDLKMDDWNLDIVVAGSQKAFMLPTGLSFIALSKKAQAVVESTQCYNYYFDLKSEKKSYHSKQTKFSSSVAEIRALDAVLQCILSQGIENFIDEIKDRAAKTRMALEIMGLSTYAKVPSPSLTVINVPPTIDGKKLRQHIEDKYNMTLMGGQDQLEGKILRIGHLGAISKEDVVASIEILGLALADFSYPTDWQKAVSTLRGMYEN